MAIGTSESGVATPVLHHMSGTSHECGVQCETGLGNLKKLYLNK